MINSCQKHFTADYDVKFICEDIRSAKNDVIKSEKQCPNYEINSKVKYHIKNLSWLKYEEEPLNQCATKTTLKI